MFNTSGTLFCTQNWMFLNIDPQICAYYRKLLLHHTWGVLALQSPLNPGHITIISKYEMSETIRSKMGVFHEREVKLEYSNQIEIGEDNIYFWLPVNCPDAQAVRHELGLGDPYYPFHLTIGNTKNKG